MQKLFVAADQASGPVGVFWKSKIPNFIEFIENDLQTALIDRAKTFDTSALPLEVQSLINESAIKEWFSGVAQVKEMANDDMNLNKLFVFAKTRLDAIHPIFVYRSIMNVDDYKDVDETTKKYLEQAAMLVKVLGDASFKDKAGNNVSVVERLYKYCEFFTMPLQN
jgi:hypothetical protein